MVCLHYYTYVNNTGAERYRCSALAISVDRQAGERLEEKWRGKRFNYLGDTVMIVQLESKEEVSELTDSCDRFCKYVNHMIGAVVTVGVGQVCDNILSL